MKLKHMVNELLAWVGVRREWALDDTHVQMARGLGVKPRRLVQPGSYQGRPDLPAS
ncbi:MAG TPA: hypothetical protein VMH22_12805 [bacterium]|nr:hypothetical protein [bacterium]